MRDNDHSYKLLFNNAELVRDLLQGFVEEDWIAELDFATLEKVASSFVADDLREREDDIIWRLRCRDSWIYIYILIEFQSTVDRFMAVRLMTYIGLLYQDLIRSGQCKGKQKLPPVFPLVLYNGSKKWSGATAIEELIETVPGGLSKYRPTLVTCYWMKAGTHYRVYLPIIWWRRFFGWSAARHRPMYRNWCNS